MQNAPLGGALAQTGQVDSSVSDPAVTTVDLARRWRQLRLGCPVGCPLDHHECGIGEPVHPSCHACGALSMTERESLETCWSVCRMRQVA
jgi:hypothetical protein